jgi:GntR family transcriptional regulator, transcriptional repressor for pyruvate dehydrogenase complex
MVARRQPQHNPPAAERQRPTGPKAEFGSYRSDRIHPELRWRLTARREGGHERCEGLGEDGPVGTGDGTGGQGRRPDARRAWRIEAWAGAAMIERIAVSKSAVDRVQALIREQGLLPGDALPAQRQLAQSLGVSRGSLREALSTLEAQGSVVVRPARGVFVAEPAQPPLWRFADQCTPREIYQARYCVESFAAALAADRLDLTNLDKLRHSIAELDDAVAGGDIEAMAAADCAFHDIILRLSGNAMIEAMYRAVREMAVESQKLPMLSLSKLEQTVAEHRAILAALEAGDGPAARDAMRHHIRSAAARYGIAI